MFIFSFFFDRPEDLHRMRVEHMERQLANLTGLVQKALTQNVPTPGPGSGSMNNSNYLSVGGQYRGRICWTSNIFPYSIEQISNGLFLKLIVFFFCLCVFFVKLSHWWGFESIFSMFLCILILWNIKCHPRKDSNLCANVEKRIINQ